MPLLPKRKEHAGRARTKVSVRQRVNKEAQNINSGSGANGRVGNAILRMQTKRAFVNAPPRKDVKYGPRKPRDSSSGTRRSIIAAAIAEFADKGYDGARVDVIAMQAGVNKNLLYHHFRSKDGLFTAVLEYTYDEIRARQRDFEVRDMDPVSGMRKLVVFTGRTWVQSPHFQRLLNSENLHEGRHVRASSKIPKMYNPLLVTIEDLLVRGVKCGAFRNDIDPVDLYISISALTAHYISNHFTFEAIFGKRLMTPTRIHQRLDHAAEMILRYCLVCPK